MASYRGDSAGIVPFARRALDYLPKDELAWRCVASIALGDANSYLGDMGAAYRAQSGVLDICSATGNLFIILYANLNLAVTLRQSGRLKRAEEICQQQMQLANESGMGHTALAGWISAIWGEVQAELNDLEGAILHAKRGLELTERGGDVMMLGWCYLCLVRVLFSMGDFAGFEKAIRKTKSFVRGSELPHWVQCQLAAWQGRAWLAQDQLEAASQWAGERGLDADQDLPYPRETEYITVARILIAQGRPNEATTLLDRLLEAAEAGGRTSRAIEMLNVQSLAYQAGGDIAQAVETMGRVLNLAEPGGFVRTFLDEGLPMAELLYAAAARGIAPDYARRLLAAFRVDETEKADPARTRASKSGLVEPLSQRELEVLHLIAEGLTNPEIAARLFVSLNTVKAHCRNIYGKLGVHNRTQAVSTASALGILPSA
jgi:LuxR family maltose regulon positive regulatory protein